MNVVLATRHTGIVVRDLGKSLSFYRDILGLEPVKRAVEKGNFIENVVNIRGVELEWVKLKSPDGMLIELLQYHSHPEVAAEPHPLPSNHLGCSHLAFTVSDIKSLYSDLTAKGFHCNSEPQNSPDGCVTVLYCHDPDGIIVELVEEKPISSK